MISLNSIFILVLINSFIFGIKSISTAILFKYKLIIHNKKLENASNIALVTLIGLFLYCVLSNLILLIPSLVFFINNEFSYFEFLVKLTISILKFLFIAISIYGLIDLLNFKSFIKKKRNYNFLYTNK